MNTSSENTATNSSVTTDTIATTEEMPIGRIFLIALGVVLFLVYSNTFHAPFVYDDKIEVIGNRTIRFLDEWQQILLYNPSRLLLQLSYALNFHKGSFDPFGYHVGNFAIACFLTMASFWSTEKLLRLSKIQESTPFSMLLSTMWILHPMTTESITYITGRSESLCALFSIFAVGAYAKSLDFLYTSPETKKFSVMVWKTLAWLAVLGGALVKEVAFVIPLIFMGMEMVFHPNRDTSTSPLGNIQPSSIVLVFCGIFAFLGLRFFVVHSAMTDPSFMDILPKLLPKEVDRPLHIQLLTQMEVWLRYGWLWLLPYGQTIFHHIPDADVASFRSLGFAIAWVVVLIALWKQSRNNPLMRFALIAMCCTLLPSSSIAALQENMAEHRAFQMGYYFLLMVLACMHFHARNTPRFQKIRAFFVFSTPFFIAIFSIASIEGTATFFRNSVWKTEVKLWQEATLHNPHSAKAWYGLGDAHRFAKQMEPALAAYATCTRLDETDLDCWNNLGITYAEMRNDSKAKEAWYHALEINSAYCKAHTNLGFLAYQRQEWDESLVELRTALVYCPDNVSAHYGLGLIYYQPRWDKNKAIHHFDMVLQLQPTFDYASDARAKLLELTW